MANKSGIHINPKNKGKLHEKLHVPEGKPIPVKKLEKAKDSSSAAERKEADFAINARHFHHGGGGAAKELAKRLSARDKR